MKRSTLLPAVTLSLAVIASAGIMAAKPVLAERLESDSYVIQFGNFNVTAGEKSSGSYNVTDTVGQTAAGPFGQYGSSNYFVGAGFQYIYQIGKFSFRLSSLAIDLGSLTPGTHNSASHTMTISTRGAGGYNVYAYELHPLRHSNGSTTIPDTTCDNNDCDQVSAATWTNQNQPGFGFNMKGDDIPSDFVNQNYFRQFADNSIAEAMQVVMTSTAIARNREATVTYKAGVSGNQASGNYQTGVVYVAVPGY
jgi:hypothetical protein